MKVAVVGSRNYPNESEVKRYVKRLPKDTVVVSGGAKGVDIWAIEAAKERGMAFREFLPEWNKYGKSAGFRRNHDIAMFADRVVAFTTGSSGTAHTMSLARRYGKPLEVHKAEAHKGESPDGGGQRRLL